MLAVHAFPAYVRQAPQAAPVISLRRTKRHLGMAWSTGNSLAHASPQVTMLRCSHIPLQSRPSYSFDIALAAQPCYRTLLDPTTSIWSVCMIMQSGHGEGSC